MASRFPKPAESDSSDIGICPRSLRCRLLFLKLGLAEFHNGTEAEIVASLRKVESETGLFASSGRASDSAISSGAAEDVLENMRHEGLLGLPKRFAWSFFHPQRVWRCLPALFLRGHHDYKSAREARPHL